MVSRIIEHICNCCMYNHSCKRLISIKDYKLSNGKKLRDLTLEEFEKAKKKGIKLKSVVRNIFIKDLVKETQNLYQMRCIKFRSYKDDWKWHIKYFGKLLKRLYYVVKGKVKRK